jgi:hypothetical protein
MKTDDLIFYKNINEQDVYLKIIYEPRINLCGKYISSQLNAYIKHRDGAFNNFLLDADDWAKENNLKSNEADAKLKEAEDFFNENNNINQLKENIEISYLLNQIDLFLENQNNLN